MRQPPDWRILVSTRGIDAHPLSRATGSNPGYPDICQEAGQPPDPSEDGQHVHADLHQQDGWNCITGTQPAHQRTMVLVPSGDRSCQLAIKLTNVRPWTQTSHKPSVGKTLIVIHAYRRKQAFGRKNTACHPCIPSSEWVEAFGRKNTACHPCIPTQTSLR